jgi:hypothetical protein
MIFNGWKKIYFCISRDFFNQLSLRLSTQAELQTYLPEQSSDVVKPKCDFYGLEQEKISCLKIEYYCSSSIIFLRFR